MKFIKKLAAGIGAAGVLLASTNALALNTKLLQFSDGANNQLFTIATTATTASAFAITINHWQLNFVVGFTGSDTGNLTMSFNGNGLFWQPGNVSTLVGGYCATGAEAECFTGVDSYTGTLADSKTLKIRLIDRNFNTVAAGSNMTLRDDFSITSQPAQNGGTAFVQISTPNSTPTQSALFPAAIGLTSSVANTYNYLFQTNSSPMQVIAGFDLVAANSMISNGLTAPCTVTPANVLVCDRYDLSNTISIARAVPEPGTLGLLGLSMLGLAAVGRKRAAKMAAAA